MSDDNTILHLLLRRRYKDGGFTVVGQMSSLPLGMESAEDLARTRQHVIEQMRLPDIDIGGLFDRLVERNRTPVRLALASAAESGYVIDEDGLYKAHFAEGGGGWEQWYEQHPCAHGLTSVSLPAQDDSGHLVLVYTGTQSHWTAGAGFLVLFRLEHGRLDQLGSAMLWIS